MCFLDISSACFQPLICFPLLQPQDYLQLLCNPNGFLKFLLCSSTEPLQCGFVSSRVPSEMASRWHFCIQLLYLCTSYLSSAASWGKMVLFGSHITDAVMAPIQLLAACAATLSVPILYISHSGVTDGVLPGLGILAWICFLNLFQCPGALATSSSSSSVSVFTSSNPEEQTTLEW